MVFVFPQQKITSNPVYVFVKKDELFLFSFPLVQNIRWPRHVSRRVQDRRDGPMGSLTDQATEQQGETTDDDDEVAT